MGVPERDDAQPVAAPCCDVADRERGTLCDVGLAPLGCAELHRRGGVEHEPRDEHPLGEQDANVRLTGPRGDGPVDAADVVAQDVRTDLSELGALPEERGAVVAGQEPFHPPPNADLERAKERVRHRPGAGPSRCLGAPKRVHAALARFRSICGVGTAAITSSRIASGVTSSASAWYVRTSRCRSASFASAWRSSGRTYSRPRTSARARDAWTRLIGPRGLAPKATYWEDCLVAVA